MEKILLFHIQKDKQIQLERLCRELKIQIRQVPIRDYAQKLGYLAGISGFPREKKIYEGKEFSSEMLIFSGMNSDSIDVFLEKYKEYHIVPVELKAIITQYNIAWTADALYQELLQEHDNYHPAKAGR